MHESQVIGAKARGAAEDAPMGTLAALQFPTQPVVILPAAANLPDAAGAIVDYLQQLPGTLTTAP